MAQFGDLTDEQGNITSKCYTKEQMKTREINPAFPPCNLLLIAQRLVEEETEADDVRSIEVMCLLCLNVVNL